MASEYDAADGHVDLRGGADRWLANILGANAWGLSLIVGDGRTFPHCLQHQVANIAGIARRHGAGAGRRRRRGTELRDDDRIACRA